MKKSMLSVIPVTALTLSLVTGANALAEQNRFYLKADIGGNSARDVELREFFGEPTLAANSTISLDPGIRLGFRAGYGITDWFAAEVETGVTANNIESISGPTVAVADGSLANVPFLLNAKLHLPDGYRVSPYIGAGFGVASTVLSGDDIVIGGTSFSGSAADAAFAYQAFAGVRFAINDRMGLSVEYHFLHTGSTSMDADLTVGTLSDTVKLGRTETHSVSVAFDIQF
jgi:opacity protein-like surface antigen